MQGNLKTMNETSPQDHPSVVIMKELSDIKTNLAVNTNETGNIKASLGKIESSVSAIQADFVSRREFGDRIALVEEQISPLKKLVYGCVAIILGGFISGLLVFIYK